MVKKIVLKSYCFTYKKNHGKPEDILMTDYSEVLSHLNEKGKLVAYEFEKDKNGRLHVHGIVEFERTPQFKKMVPHGFHSHFEVMYNEEGWKKYMKKNQP